jgi:membrane-associated phospholipid phosphatase
MQASRAFATIAFVLGLSNTELAWTQPGSVAEAEEQDGDRADPPARRSRLVWREEWRRVNLVEYVSTGVFLTSSFVLLNIVPSAERERWSRPILFDSGARKLLALEARSARTTASTISDYLAIASTTQPLLIDNFAVTLVADRNPDVAWQMFVINAQSYAIAGAANTLTKHLTARERPYGIGCTEDPEYTSGCTTDERFKSFYSGHSAITATSAGLVCAHHTHLSLYGGGTADTAACLAAVGFTTGTGVLRISSDRHWASDVLIGHLSGYLVGYLLPTLVYYHDIRLAPEMSRAGGMRVALQPVFFDGAVQLNAVGWL